MSRVVRGSMWAAAALTGLVGTGLIGTGWSRAEWSGAGRASAQESQTEKPAQSQSKPAEPGAPAAQAPGGDYWIGVQLEEPNETLRSQLNIPFGLVIRQVLDDSPAKRAELRLHDVIVAVNDKPLQAPSDLIEAVQANPERELTLTIIRQGQKMNVKLKPTRRPEGVAGAVATEERDADDLLPLSVNPGVFQDLDVLIRRFQAQPGQPPVVLWSMRSPVVATPPGKWLELGLATKLPSNVSVQITKSGDEPAKIVVKQGDKTYETTADKLETLPAELQGVVKPMLEPPASRRVLTVPAPPAEAPTVAAKVAERIAKVRRVETEAQGELAKKLDAILERLEKLQADVESLKK